MTDSVTGLVPVVVHNSSRHEIRVTDPARQLPLELTTPLYPSGSDMYDVDKFQNEFFGIFENVDDLGVVHNCHHFHERTQRTLFCDPLPPLPKAYFLNVDSEYPVSKGPCIRHKPAAANWRSK